MDRIETQSKEFDAVQNFTRAFRQLPAVVDDDYPERRAAYEVALDRMLESFRVNGREVPEYTVTGSRAEIGKHQSLPHIAVMNKLRALRWHPGGLLQWSASDWGVALAGEVGEICNVIKKLNRYHQGLQQVAVNMEASIAGVTVPEFLSRQLAKEIGDVFIYLDLLAQREGLNLDDCVRDAFNSVSTREGFPEKL